MRIPVIAVLVALAPAGCGSADTEVSGKAWPSQAQAACVELHRVVESLEPPQRVDQINSHPSLVSTRRTLDAILAREAPQSAGPLREELRALERALGQIQAEALAGDTAAILEETRKAGARGAELEARARKAGAPECGDQTALTRTLDHARTPAYVHYAQINLIDASDEIAHWMTEFRLSKSASDAGDNLAYVHQTADEANTQLGSLDAPLWARGPHDEYLDALDDLSNEANALWQAFPEKGSVTRPKREALRRLRRVERRLADAGRALRGTIATAAPS